MKFTVQFLVEPDGDGFHAYSPALPGLHTDGASEREAVREFVAAVPAYLESVLQHGDPLPVGVIVDAPPVAAVRHTEEITVPWVPPFLLTSGDNSRI
ncbi:MAG TPA: type II toxin-antitoxin system HicB family antitoxin [Vicinamibacterales bacterium]|jgi:predicted RNase H-like HicB family nuclease|nr:type II toxin-antitoxin system HicB family antitoxin [Vicinamibacterales bacterium]